MATCLITFSAVDPQLATLPGAKLVFTPYPDVIRGAGNQIMTPNSHSVTADGSGAGSIALAPGQYQLTMTATRGQRTAQITVPDAETALLGDLVDATFGDWEFSELQALRAETRAWAENAEDVPVLTGLFSAKHWAAKAWGYVQQAMAWAQAAAQSAINAALYDPTLRYPSATIMFASTRGAAGVGTQWQAEGWLYEEVASGEHRVTAGGVKLRAKPFRPGCYHVAQVGAVGSGNETAVIQAFADAIPAGSELHFDGTKTYTLNVTTKNAIRFMVNGATLINATNTAVILGIQPDAGEIVDHAVVEMTLARDAQTFTVAGASTLFSVGDIGVLWDNALRTSDNQAVNFECVKIEAISGNVVTLEAPLEGNMSAGAIVFRRSTRQIKNAGIVGARVRPTASHTAQCLMIQHVENPIAGGNDISGHTGVALAVRNCYGGNLGDNRPTRPVNTGSGQGYGVALVACSNTVIGDTIGDACRHVLDFDSCYRINFGVAIDMNAVSVPLTLRHNGFGGSIRGKGLMCRVVADPITGETAYPVVDSAQGYSTGANRALAANHIMRNSRLDWVDAELDGNPNVFVVGIYLQNGADGVTIGELRMRYLNNTALTNTAASTAVRINGPVLPGGFTIEKVICDRIGSVFNRLDDNSFAGAQGVINIGHIEVTGTVGRMVWIRGGGSLRVGSFYAGGNTGLTLFETVTLFSNTPARVDIGPGQYGGTETLVYLASANIPGEIAPLFKSVGAGLTSPAGATYTATQIQNRAGLVRIAGAVGSSTDVIGTFPPPDYNGQVIRVFGKAAGRNNVSIPAAASFTGSAITFDTATPARVLVGYNGLWVPLG